MNTNLTIYCCGFCQYEFPLFRPFPDDIMPYCPNCSCDDDIAVSVIGRGWEELQQIR